MTAKEIIKKLKTFYNAKNIKGKAKFGITAKNVIGGPTTPVLRKMAGQIRKNHTKTERHKLALELYDSGIHEAKSLATLIDVPELVDKKQMESWALRFENWADCDDACSRLFDRTPFAYNQAQAWAKRKEEFVRRAGFALMATLSVHDKSASDEKLREFFPLIKKYSADERNFVKKAVNWALRQIGKRNSNLRQDAIKLAKEIEKLDSKSARWIAKDALKELEKM